MQTLVYCEISDINLNPIGITNKTVCYSNIEGYENTLYSNSRFCHISRYLNNVGGESQFVSGTGNFSYGSSNISGGQNNYMSGNTTIISGLKISHTQIHQLYLE